MYISIQDLFRPTQLDFSPSPSDYEKILQAIKSADALSRITYNSIYLIDFYKKEFLYVSDNPLFLCGKTAKQVQQSGYLFYSKNVPEEDIKLLQKLNEAGFEFYKNLLPKEKLSYSISYDFRLKQASGYLTLVNHRLTPMTLDNNGKIWIAACAVSASSNINPGNMVIKNMAEKRMFQYDLHTDKWNECKIARLNNQEKQILMMSVQGYKVEQIAEQLFLSKDTIKFHRKNILKKIKAKNITEAIRAAENYGII